jgi:hypothetical protein
MRIANNKILNDSTISIDIFIKSTDSSFELTSYQCILEMAGSHSIFGFSYVEGSSELGNLLPSVALGINNFGGEIKMTFASLPGEEIISSKELLVGRFLINSDISENDSIPIIKWGIDGKVSTILTGKDFENITNPRFLLYQINGQIPIQEIKASSTTSPTSPYNLIDGKGSSTGDNNSIWKTDKMPAYLIFDLGFEHKISKTKFSFNNWDKGRIYRYSIYSSDDTLNWNELVSNSSSACQEWTENDFDNLNARYIKLLILSNNENEWATLWEAQIYGLTEISDTTNAVTGITEKDKTIPDNYTLSQNYPNPFNPSTKINFSLKEQGKVNLEVYNILGERVASLVNGDMAAGNHEINFKAENLASGIYIYRLNVENKFTAVKKMILMK